MSNYIPRVFEDAITSPWPEHDAGLSDISTYMLVKYAPCRLHVAIISQTYNDVYTYSSKKNEINANSTTTHETRCRVYSLLI